MWRTVSPIALFLVGAALVVYGATSHVTRVLVEQETEPAESSGPRAEPPSPFDDGPWPPADPFSLNPPSEPAPSEADTAPQMEIVALFEPEPSLIRDVTVGGLMLLPDGDLKRTYVGAPPAQCPT
jgi:hypothetical protein